ncbi:MAG: 2-dehydropantoate 2-reductase [Chloroflexi bacterium]|nr:2-dehydropantoate 2-reductase [Chloroflexota bacterium]MBT3864355.1 2-dehydropantoate 2-reductase [Chloroflexota bacterium]MBT4142102.1 2-dehydropantoate 2-reductase [Chloroflexota bacterium]MBT4943571.1 2-dehydropantoate 2-reductase [Chloroflexota bacterium]MBT5476936.1 2-dehydropantoate 2-reductase [Chloroflexota bacterium]
MSDNNFRVAVVGAGGTGAYYGGALARAGAQVTMIARGAHLDAINKNGLQLQSALLGDFEVECAATDDMSTVDRADLVIFAVKSWGTDAAIEAMDSGGMVGEGTLIISMQNGIDSEPLLTKAFGAEHVLGCTATVSALISEPGVVKQAGGPGSLVIGELGDQQPNNGKTSVRVATLVEQCVEAGLAAESHENIEMALWMKFTFICALSGMTALTRKPIGDIFAQKTTTKMYRQVLSEVAAIARAKGIEITQELVDITLKTTQGREPFIIGSMGHDLIAGNPIEIGLLNARVVEMGKELGVPTPANFAIEAALRPHEDGDRNG